MSDDKKDNEVLSRDDILYKNIISKARNTGSAIYDEKGYTVNKDVEKAMDEYAQQEAIAFVKWVTGQINPIYVCNGNGTWEVIKPSPTPQPKEFISDKPLYNLYKEQSK